MMRLHDAFALITIGAWFLVLLMGESILYPMLLTAFAVILYLWREQ